MRKIDSSLPGLDGISKTSEPMTPESCSLKSLQCWIRIRGLFGQYFQENGELYLLRSAYFAVWVLGWLESHQSLHLEPNIGISPHDGRHDITIKTCFSSWIIRQSKAMSMSRCLFWGLNTILESLERLSLLGSPPCNAAPGSDDLALGHVRVAAANGSGLRRSVGPGAVASGMN